MKYLLFIFMLLNWKPVLCQITTEKIPYSSSGYGLNYYDENLSLIKAEKYFKEKCIESKTYNPNNNFLEGKVFDRVNTLHYDQKSILNSLGKLNFNAPEYLNKLPRYPNGSRQYDEVIISNLELINGLFEGKAYIIGYKYKTINTIDPYSNYLLEEIFGKNAPIQYLTQVDYNNQPIMVDTIGTFTMIKGDLQGDAHIHLGSNYYEYKFIDGSPIYAMHDADGYIVSEFKVGSSTYKFNNEIYKSPSIQAPNTLQLFIEKKLQNIPIDKFSYSPKFIFDFFSGEFQFINNKIQTSYGSHEDGYDGSLHFLEMYYYDSSGTYYTIINDGKYFENDQGDRWNKPFQAEDIPNIMPKYYFKLKFSNISSMLEPVNYFLPQKIFMGRVLPYTISFDFYSCGTWRNMVPDVDNFSSSYNALSNAMYGHRGPAGIKSTIAELNSQTSYTRHHDYYEPKGDSYKEFRAPSALIYRLMNTSIAFPIETYSEAFHRKKLKNASIKPKFSKCYGIPIVFLGNMTTLSSSFSLDEIDLDSLINVPKEYLKSLDLISTSFNDALLKSDVYNLRDLTLPELSAGKN